MATGIRIRHRTDCSKLRGAARCNCNPTYEAWVAAGARGQKMRRSFKTESAAKAWRAEAHVAINRGELNAGPTCKVCEAATELTDGMQAGTVRTRSGDAYKPSACRAYDEALRLHVLPAIGALRLSEVRRKHVQAIADHMHKHGKSPSTIRNAIMPVRVIFRRAIRAGEVSINPCTNLDLPAVRSHRERIPSPQESAGLLAVLPEHDRALWATALFAGLRRGELRALRWDDVDLAAGVIHVRRAMDIRGSIIAPKSKAGTRTVPIARALRSHLGAHRLRNGSARYVFGNGERPFEPTGVAERARGAWAAAELEPIGLHDARHAAASVLIAAGVNVKALAAYMGHASITITLDRYGHLFPGNEGEAAALVDAYLARVEGALGGADGP
jgi:integrase